MAGRYDRNPFDEQEEVNPFANPGSVPAASNSRLSPLPPEPAGFGYGRTVDIPLDRPGVFYTGLIDDGVDIDLKKKEKALQAKEAELRRREQDLKRKEDAAARAGIVIEAKNLPPFFPLIHHDIANEIPVRLQRLQYIAFATYLEVIVPSTLDGFSCSTCSTHTFLRLCCSCSSYCLQRKITCGHITCNRYVERSGHWSGSSTSSGLGYSALNLWSASG